MVKLSGYFWWWLGVVGVVFTFVACLSVCMALKDSPSGS